MIGRPWLKRTRKTPVAPSLLNSSSKKEEKSSFAETVKTPVILCEPLKGKKMKVETKNKPVGVDAYPSKTSSPGKYTLLSSPNISKSKTMSLH